MAWSNVHPDAPLDDNDRPIHPEKGYPICGYEKTDATDKNGRKREDIPYCLSHAGWGTQRDTGHCRNHYGASTGAPEGWANGNARHLLYSDRMNDDDREIFENVVKGPDGDLMTLDDMADMLRQSIGWEFTRLVRAVDATPGVRMVERWFCPDCGDTKFEEAGECDNVVYANPETGTETECGYAGSFEVRERFVEFGDGAVQLKEKHLASLIRTYRDISEGETVNVKADHDVTHRGDPDAPVKVDISHVQVDLPDDEKVDPDVDDPEE